MLQYTNSEEARPWHIAYAVLQGVVLFAVLPFALLTFARIKSRRDPTRRFVPWLKASFASFLLFLCLNLAQIIIATCAVHGVTIGPDTIRAASHLGYLAELFQMVSAACVMMTLLELGPNISRAHRGNISSGRDRTVRYGGYFIFFVVVAIAISYYALYVDARASYPDPLAASPDRVSLVMAATKLIAAAAIILWIMALFITALSVYTWLRARGSLLSGSSTLYVVIGSLNLLSQTYIFAYAVRWVLPPYVAQGYHVQILTIILAWWSRGLLLILSYFVAAKSMPKGGVWSISDVAGPAPVGQKASVADNRESYSTAASGMGYRM